MTDTGDSERSLSFDSISKVDTTRANPARMYDYALGGGHNFAIDREIAEEMFRQFPTGRHVALTNRAFLHRAVRYCLDAGMDQFLDLGSGIPTRGNTHEFAQQHNPDARVVYVDNEPVAVAHTRQMLRANPGAAIVHADIRDPDAVLHARETRELIDFGRPVTLLLVAVLHYVGDNLSAIMERYRSVCAPGSMLVISHTTADNQPEAAERLRALLAASATPVTHRSRHEVQELFAGWELVDPGLVWTPQWHPDPADPVEPHPEASETWCGVAYKLG
jgi:hypothetical protein